MAQQYQAQQQSMGEQQPMQQSDTQARPASQIPAAAPRAKKTLVVIKDPTTLWAINAMDITQPQQKSITNTGIIMDT
jgi:hypothetical protein